MGEPSRNRAQIAAMDGADRQAGLAELMEGQWKCTAWTLEMDGAEAGDGSRKRTSDRDEKTGMKKGDVTQQGSCPGMRSRNGTGNEQQHRDI